MARDKTGRGTPEDRSKTSQRAADIVKRLEREAAQREAEQAKDKK